MNPIAILAIFAVAIGLKMLGLLWSGTLSARSALKAFTPLAIGAVLCLQSPAWVMLGMADAFNPSTAHINAALTQLVVKHPTNAAFIADEIVNVVPVNFESDKFWRIKSAGLLDHRDKVPRAAGAESNKVKLDWDQDSYICTEKALHDDLPWSTRANADDDKLGLELEHVALPRESVLLAKEINSAGILFSTTYMTNNQVVTSAWDGATASSIKPWTDMLNAQYMVQKFGGARADNMAMGFKTWKWLAIWIMSQGGTASGIRWAGIQEALKENPLNIPVAVGPLSLHVGTAMYSTADTPANISRAASGGNISDVWNGSVLVYHKGVAGVKSVCLASRFMKSGWPHVRSGDYSGPRECSWYEYAENESGVKVIAASLGCLITSVNS